MVAELAPTLTLRGTAARTTGTGGAVGRTVAVAEGLLAVLDVLTERTGPAGAVEGRPGMTGLAVALAVRAT